MKYKVVTEDNHNEVWARGFYGEAGKIKAEQKIKEGYFHKFMFPIDKHKTLIVIPD
jgi:hypothetical protein